MLTQADKDFLTLEREQKALFRAQAQIPSDISETSSQPAMVEDEDEEIEEIPQDYGSQLEIQEIEVSEAELNHFPLESEIMIEKIQEETSPIVVTPQQNQEQALELLKSAFEQIKLALSLLNDAPKAGSQNLHQEIETISKTLVPISEEPVAQLAAEPVAQLAAEPVVEVATEPVAQMATEPVASKAAESFASKVAKTAVQKVSKIVAPKAPEAEKVVAPKATASAQIVSPNAVAEAAKTFAPKATASAQIVFPKATASSQIVASKAAEEEFKVVMPKKSKNASAIIVVPKDEVLEQKDEFPSLVRTISPVQQKAGFWSSGRNSLQIAKSIAQIPSPPPTRSSPLIKTVKSRENSRGDSRDAIDEENEYSDDEFRTRKTANYEDEDDYWQ